MNIVSWVTGIVKLRGDSDGTKIGNVGDALKVTSEDQDRVNLVAGDAYCVNMEYSLNNGQTVYQSFKTPNTSTRIYIKAKLYSADRSEVQLWENPTGVTYSFSWTPKNRNRESSNTSASTLQAVNTQTSAGTFLCKDSTYGSGITTTSSPIQITQEWLLDQDTEYLFAMKSYAASNLTTLQLQWYEVG